MVKRAGGLLLQQLPAQLTPDPERTTAVSGNTLAPWPTTVTDAELLSLNREQLLHRLYHQDPLRLFEPSAVRFQCNCSRERTFNALASLPPLDLEELLEELGSITMDCEFCNQQYCFNREDLSEILVDSVFKTMH